MQTHLPPDAANWIEAQIKAGVFKTADEAITFAIRQVAPFDSDLDLEWVKPLLAEAEDDIKHGLTLTLEEFRVRMQARKDGLPA